MTLQVHKRNGTVEDFSFEKLSNAVYKAFERTSEVDAANVDLALNNAVQSFKFRSSITSTNIMNAVEVELMNIGAHSLAKEFILYRESHKPDVFRKRVNYKPFEYPQVVPYGEAVHNSFWLHTHYNYNPDIQDLRSNMTEGERQVAERAMLAISQIEVAVKSFWGDIGKRFPKPEIAEVGAIFADSEVRHAKAYSNLIEIMGLNEEFLKITEVPVIKKRIQYLERSLTTPVDNQDYFKNIILFSLFIENISLFSQFYILKSFYRHKQYLSGIDNAVSATSKEEDLHAQFGVELIKIIKQENPSWWTQVVISDVISLSEQAMKAELEIVDWIFEGVDIDYLQKDEIKSFISKRMADSLNSIGIPSLFVGMTTDFEWFELELIGTKGFDFFKQKGVAYSKGMKSFSEEDLF